MNREPMFKRQVLGVLRLFGLGSKNGAEEGAVEDLHVQPTTDDSLNPARWVDTTLQRRSTNLVKRKVVEIIDRAHDDLDRRSLESKNRTLEAAEETLDRTIAIKTKSHKLRHLEPSLDRKEQLAQVEDEALLAEARQRVDKAHPASGDLRRVAEEATLKSAIARENANQRYYDAQARGKGPLTEERNESEPGTELDKTDRERRAAARDYVDGAGLDG